MSEYFTTVERWGVQEIRVEGPKDGNPFTEQWIQGTFQGTQESVSVDGFYDGDGIYIVRFMPSFEGSYRFELAASFELSKEDRKGVFEVTKASEGNHGPVRVERTFHFAYEDGTRYFSIGTTCYVWALQSDELIRETLETLRQTAFNKIRFCILPKHYDFNLREPRSYPFEGTPIDSSVLTRENFKEYDELSEGNHWDFTRFNPEHFRHLERCILKLEELGIEADLIVMHPYDRWGFSNMSKEQDTLYWSYVIARFAAYRNVWWSLANEYDLMKHKTIEDWESYAALLCKKDPYRHLRSIHNCKNRYDYSRPWVTHCSVQRTEVYKTAELVDYLREAYGKPVVMDEMSYEGDFPYDWGNITAEEMVRRFWETVCRGGYPGHGETYFHSDLIVWWSHGGRLYGESWKRFQFLLDIMKETPDCGLKFLEQARGEVRAVSEERTIGRPGPRDYYLMYYSFMRPAFKDYYFDDTTEYRVKVIDTWEMTVTDLGVQKGKIHIELPAKQYMAVQFKKV
ncbi:MAG: DUF5605 domain-containing protein [Lachnospiraceae bacterium]|nr:DUF5605 domain-containing protein [Lachnospiraceae bacterium]